MPWDEWEDYAAGLYRHGPFLESRSAAAAALLRDGPAFLETASEMVREWERAAAQNLGNWDTGRRAWIGQAACCYALGAIGNETRTAWGTLTDSERAAANAIADIVIGSWERGLVDAQALPGL